MKEFEKIESLLKSKSYDKLSAKEREVVNQELNQETYDEIRQGIYKLKAEKLKVSKGVKQSLMAEFKEHETPVFAFLFQRRIPVYGLLLPLIVLIALFFYRPVKEVPVIQDRLVEVTLRDTIQVVQTDTIWREKIVQVPKLVYVSQKEEDKPEKMDIVNRSLSDQKELLDLVIRGD